MKKVIKISALAAAVLLAAGCQEKTTQAPEVELNTDDQKAAYAIGASVGNFASQTLKQQDELGVVLDRALVQQGLLDALADQVKMNDEEMGATLRSHEQKMNTVVQEKAREKREETRKTGAKYLEDNASKEGVSVTESGLQYEVIKQGEGPQPTAADTVTVHYTGTLTDGTVFDSSKQRGQPATFPLANVIKGWTEGVALMPVGSEYRLTIPAELAYGDQDVGTIPAGSVLVFDVELISIEDKQESNESADSKQAKQ
ncbi:FKBP-type peptidyl-prolyl cis-trans isomerase [Endozoicomonas sp. SCSIO W0465]|uniref:FKBP-type peptidyl-prolyl cis-trans isomerase n=1 Tax=Endozoicomonas sp. SCSIO W0465 TaxID=2918516 RepID=UPI0020762BF2|nr:FKBP-type peptidyl-prolyl cis-trans isomerase [Endozoicomonas sp. SCSIO W0465]USE34739.1 FKBP-type peptidyl-prolyl cis-trans isomerase [Endozoicomonas sp. SCSIO W0465]